MAYMMRKIGEMQREKGANVYAYHFVHQPPYEEGARDLGACHTCEIRYVFKNLDMPGIIPDTSSPEMAASGEVHQRVSDIMSSYWVNFAKTGDPNGAYWMPAMSLPPPLTSPPGRRWNARPCGDSGRRCHPGVKWVSTSVPGTARH